MNHALTTSLPVYSMTAFGRAQANYQDEKMECQYQWEVRSVNQRYIEVNFRLPDAYRHLESAIRDAIKQYFQRGKFDVSLSIRQDSLQPLQINDAVLGQLKTALASLQQAIPDAAPVNPVELLKWPGLVQQASENGEESELDTHLMTSFSEALKNLKAQRLREGQALAQVILSRCDAITDTIAMIKPIMPEIIDAHQQRFQQRITHLQANIDEQRYHQEVALLAQKMDIEEEIDRIQIHIIEVKKVLETDEAKGRRLDFLMQELNREANTLGSKSVDPRTSQASVDLKVLIEQMREQVQNIE